MGDFVRFVSRSDLERARLIREARAIYESVFPTEEVGAHKTTATPGREKADDIASRHSRERWQERQGDAPSPPHGREPA